MPSYNNSETLVSEVNIKCTKTDIPTKCPNFNGRDEPLSPIGKMLLQKDLCGVINCLIALEKPIELEAARLEFENSPWLKHPRFCSVLVRDKNGKEHWRKTQVDLERHFIILEDRVGEGEDDEAIVNQYMADLAVSSPLSTDKPLWEFHFLMAHKCVAIRIHHALGDGISLMSLFLACCRKVDDPNQSASLFTPSLPRNRSDKCKAWMFLMVWYSFIYIINLTLRTLWIKDPKTAISGGRGMELWPRTIATAKLRLDDMKAVKKAMTDTTINDVFIAILSSGLSKYLHQQTPKVQEALQLTGVIAVNIRQLPGVQEYSSLMRSSSKSRWGNEVGVYLLPLNLYKSVASPLDYLSRGKAVITKKKLSAEASFSHVVLAGAIRCFGPKVACSVLYRLARNTTLAISSVAGPQEKISLAGNPVKFMRFNTSSLPQALQISMLSYAGSADMQIMVAKDIIPDPQFLAKCFEDSLLEMKDAAPKLQV